jgi:hypothetical protein
MRTRSLLLAFLIGAATTATARPAAAMCASPSATLFPVAGTPLPAAPTLYLFVPTRYEDAALDPGVTAKDATTGEPLEVQVRLVNRGADLAGYEVHVDARERVIELAAPGLEPARYPLGSAYEVARRHVVIDEVGYESDYWTCSHTEAVTIAGRGNPAALRLDWLVGGEVRSAYLPPSLGEMWRWEAPGPLELARAVASEVVGSPIDLTIGYASCLGNTVDPALLARERDVRLVAVFADRSTAVLGAGPIRVSRVAMAVPRALVGASVDRREPVAATAVSRPRAPITADVPAPAAAPPCHDRCSDRAPRMAHFYLAAFGLGVLVVAAAILARRRSRAISL